MAGYPGHPVHMQPQTGQTTVIVQQPQRIIIQERDWSSGLCACGEDMATCCAVYWCAACYQCYLTSQMGEGCCAGCLVPYALPMLRLKMRTQQNIKGSILEDCLMTEFCFPCVMCQLKREHDTVMRQSGYHVQ